MTIDAARHNRLKAIHLSMLVLPEASEAGSWPVTGAREKDPHLLVSLFHQSSLPIGDGHGSRKSPCCASRTHTLSFCTSQRPHQASITTCDMIRILCDSRRKGKSRAMASCRAVQGASQAHPSTQSPQPFSLGCSPRTKRPSSYDPINKCATADLLLRALARPCLPCFQL